MNCQLLVPLAALNIEPALAMTGDDLRAVDSFTELFPDLFIESTLTQITNQPARMTVMRNKPMAFWNPCLHILRLTEH